MPPRGCPPSQPPARHRRRSTRWHGIRMLRSSGPRREAAAMVERGIVDRSTTCDRAERQRQAAPPCACGGSSQSFPSTSAAAAIGRHRGEPDLRRSSGDAARAPLVQAAPTPETSSFGVDRLTAQAWPKARGQRVFRRPQEDHVFTSGFPAPQLGRQKMPVVLTAV